MKRQIENTIIKWLESKNKALLIEGARQVGKTYSIRKVLNEKNINYFEINFIERPEILESLKNINDIDDFIEKLQLYSPKKLLKKQSIIFFDEIQCFPEIITKIKFLVDEGSFSYILSGSLLGIELTGIKSIPVGYLEIVKMYPMTFIEFVKELGVSDKIINYLYDCYRNLTSIDDIIHKKLLSLFYKYLIIGGMPSVVKNFIEYKNLDSLYNEQQNIINLYKKDFTQYELVNNKLKLISIYDNIPSQLSKQNLKFQFVYLNKELKFDRYENSFLWLKDAGVSLPVYNTTQPVSPLVISKEKNNFKLFLSDVGLLTSCYPASVRIDILNNINNEYNNGSLFENFACQEMVSNNLVPYYFKNSKIGEIDFLIEIDGIITAIEIKSGKSYTKHKSLNNIVSSYKNVKPIIFCTENIKKDNFIYMPIYMIEFLKNKTINENITIDLDGLK